MHNIVHNIGVAAQTGSYSDAIEAPPGARWLFTSGTRVLPLPPATGWQSPKKW